MSASASSRVLTQIRDLGKYGFPKSVVDTLSSRGFVELNPIQQASLDSGLLKGQSLLIVAPTSSGKTLIAELAAIHHAIHGKGVFYLVSLKALAEEKYELFRRFWTGGDEQLLKTAITTGDRDFQDDGLSQTQVTFATYEKFYALIKDNPELLSHISLIVVDELQTLGDRSRGVVLEMLLTLVSVSNPSIQIVGLSAALPNANEVAEWLNAKVCISKIRDIPLIEEIWTTSTIYSKTFGQGADLITTRVNPTKSVETFEIVQSVIEKKQTPMVVFCMTKPRTEQLARAHYDAIRRKSPVRKVVEGIKQLLLFFTEGGPTGRSLMDVVDAGIAFHHSDLSPDERRVIEDKIREGAIEVTYSTTTLGQGVNLPIATVVFDDVYRSWLEQYIDRREYINMAGRAGRRGLKDEKGTSILICRSAKDHHRMNQFLSEEAETVESVLEHAPLDAIVLNVVAARDTSSDSDVATFIGRSFFGTRYQVHNPKTLKSRIDAVPSVLEQLAGDGFVVVAEDGKFKPTELGRVTVQKGITPRTAQVIIRRLQLLAAVFPAGEDLSVATLQLGAGTLHAFADCDGEYILYRDGSATATLSRSRDSMCTVRRYIDPDDPDRALQVGWVLSEWIQGTSYQKLCAPFRNLREGLIRSCAEHCRWMVDSAAAIARVRALKLDAQIPAHLQGLARRLTFGVPDAGVAIAEVARNRIALGVELGGLGRGKIMDLLKAGYDDLNKIIEADDLALAGILRNQDQATNLKLGVARFIERTSSSTLPTHSLRARKFSCEELVAAVYAKDGVQFEAAVCNLLKFVGVRAELLDERKVPGCADLLISTAAGNIQVECKTRAKGLVANSEAFEVLGKTVVGPKPVAFVTVGKPGFVPVAANNSFTAGVTLLTHKTIVELAMMVLEQKKTLDNLLSIMQLARNVEPADLK